MKNELLDKGIILPSGKIGKNMIKYLKLPIDSHGTSWIKVNLSGTGGRPL